MIINHSNNMDFDHLKSVTEINKCVKERKVTHILNLGGYDEYDRHTVTVVNDWVFDSDIEKSLPLKKSFTGLVYWR